MEKTEFILAATKLMLRDMYNVGLCIVSTQSGADQGIGDCAARYCEYKIVENPEASIEEIVSLAVTNLQSDLGMAV